MIRLLIIGSCYQPAGWPIAGWSIESMAGILRMVDPWLVLEPGDPGEATPRWRRLLGAPLWWSGATGWRDGPRICDECVEDEQPTRKNHWRMRSREFVVYYVFLNPLTDIILLIVASEALINPQVHQQLINGRYQLNHQQAPRNNKNHNQLIPSTLNLLCQTLSTWISCVKTAVHRRSWLDLPLGTLKLLRRCLRYA